MARAGVSWLVPDEPTVGRWVVACAERRRAAPSDAAPPGPAPKLWERQAQHWSLLERPLRPGDQDLAAVQPSIDRLGVAGTAPSTALILGVTPELVSRPWSPATTVLATDVSMVMIRGVGAGGRPPAAPAAFAQADWLHLPLRRASCDLVLGDASFANVVGAEAPALVASVRRVLRPGGVLTTRMFVRPDHPEEPDEVWAELVDGRIGTFAAFKLRLLMALSDDDGDVGVAVGWEFFRARAQDVEPLARHLGWPPEVLRTIEAYRDQPTRYWFPTVAQFRSVLAREFDERWCATPTYELGDRCPTFVFG